MQMMRYIEGGSIRMMWVTCMNPAVSLPELSRIRSILSQDRLFLVVQDLPVRNRADRRRSLPAATWGQKTGTIPTPTAPFTSERKAIHPPGEAKADLDIFIDYAHRLGLKDKDGERWSSGHDPESAFEAWKECSRGRPCDYTGITYDKLRGGSGVQWPCNEGKSGRHRAAIRRRQVLERSRVLRELRT